MRVTVINNHLNIRVGEPRLHAPTYQYLAPGSEIEVDGKVYKGDLYKDIDTWLRDGANNYYWSGGVNSLTELLNQKITFSWFKQLEIDTIWNKFNERGDMCKVAVLDTGYDIENKDISTAVSDFTTDFIDFPSTSRCKQVQDLVGHGTRCSSLIGGRNLQSYNVGIAPECKILIVKIACKLEESKQDSILNGIKWSLDKGAEVISISQVIDLTEVEKIEFESKLREIIKNKKVLIFACAGNSDNGRPSFGERYPASFPQCISVGATHQGKFNDITVQSDKTIIHAPGIDIESYDLTSTPTADSGTSFSTPIVAGIAALAISYKKKQDAGVWDPELIKDLIYRSGLPLFGNKKLIQPIQLFNQLKK